MAVGAFNSAILMGDTAIVARRLHRIMFAQRVISPRQIRPRVCIEIAECCREAVTAMQTWGAAQRPQRILQAFGQGDIALAAEDDMGVLEARPDQPEMIEKMLERLAGDSDRHIIEVAHIGEVRQAHAARLVGLTENDLPVLAMPRTPCPDAPLHGPPDTGREIRMPAKHLLEYGDRPQPGRRLEKRDDLGVENLCQRVWSASFAGLGLLGRQFAFFDQAISRCPAYAGFGGRHG